MCTSLDWDLGFSSEAASEEPPDVELLLSICTQSRQRKTKCMACVMKGNRPEAEEGKPENGLMVLSTTSVKHSQACRNPDHIPLSSCLLS